MRILYLHQYFRTPDMGGITRSYEMARRLVDRGHTVEMITADCSPKPGAPAWRTEVVSGITVHWTPVAYDNRMSLAERMLSFVTFAVRSSLRAAQIKSDVIFATSTPLTIGIPGLYASWVNKTPMVFEVRDLWPDVPIALGALKDPISRWMALKLEEVIYRKSKHIVALAPGMREDIIAKGIPAEKVSVVPNGADLPLFGVDEAAGKEIRRSYEWLADRPMIIYAGAVSTANGVDYLVRLAAATKAIDPEIRFVVAGTGRDVDYVSSLAAEHDVLNKSFFMLGSLPKEQVAKWLSAASMTCAMLTGPRIVWKDAVSNKFFDSLAAGRPVANNFDGFSSRVARDAGAGIILDPDDVDAAAKDLVAHIRDEAWLTSARAAAKRLGEERFSRDLLAGDLEKVLIGAADLNDAAPSGR